MKIFSARKSFRRIAILTSICLVFCGTINLINSLVGDVLAADYPTDAGVIADKVRNIANNPFTVNGNTVQHGYRYNGSPASNSDIAEETTGGFYINNRGNDGPDYSCSSLIYHGLVDAKIFQGEFATIKNVSTKRMNYLLSARNDFDNVSSNVNFASGVGLQKGDILINNNISHIAIVSKVENGSIYIIQATANSDGAAYDSTSDGKELSESRYVYDQSQHFRYWAYAYRYNKDKSHDITDTAYCPAADGGECQEADTLLTSSKTIPAKNTEKTDSFVTVSTDGGGDYEVRSENMFSGVFETNDIAFQNLNVEHATLVEYDENDNEVTNAADKMFGLATSSTDKQMISYKKAINGGNGVGINGLSHYFTLRFKNAVVFRRTAQTYDLLLSVKEIYYQTAANSSGKSLSNGFGLVINSFGGDGLSDAKYSALQLGALRVKGATNTLDIGAKFNTTLKMLDSNGNVVNDDAEFLFKFIGLDSRDITESDCASSWNAANAKYAESITILGGFEKHIWAQNKVTQQLQFVSDGSGLRVMSNGKRSDGTSYCSNTNGNPSSIGENSMLTGFLARGNLGANNGVRFRVRTSLGNAQTMFNTIYFPDIKVDYDRSQGAVRSNFWGSTVGGESHYRYSLGEQEAFTITPENNDEKGHHYIKSIKISNRANGVNGNGGEFKVYTLGDFKEKSEIEVEHGVMNNSPNSVSKITLRYKGNGVVDVIFPAQYAFTGETSYLRAGQPIFSDYTIKVEFAELPSNANLDPEEYTYTPPVEDDDLAVENDDTETAASYTVTFNSNGGSAVASQTVASGGKATKPTNPTRTGYTFAGWLLNAKTYNFNSAVTKDITLYAKWTRNTYTVTFDSNGGSSVASTIKEHGATIGTLPTPTRTGYTLTGWYTAKTGGNKISNSTIITKNITYYAHWTKKKYTVTFDANVGSSVASMTREHGATIGTLPTSTRTGYTLVGWYTAKTGGDKISSSTTVTADVTYYAHWTKNNYTVTFNSNGGSAIASQTVAYGNKATKPTNPTREGYAFEGWYSNSGLTSKFNFNTTITKNTTIYAKWIKNAEPMVY